MRMFLSIIKDSCCVFFTSKESRVLAKKNNNKKKNTLKKMIHCYLNYPRFIHTTKLNRLLQALKIFY